MRPGLASAKEAALSAARGQLLQRTPVTSAKNTLFIWAVGTALLYVVSNNGRSVNLIGGFSSSQLMSEKAKNIPPKKKLEILMLRK